MEIKKIIISMLLLVVFLPIVLAQQSIENESNDTNNYAINNTNYSDNICEEDSINTCNILTDLGVVEGVSVPLVLPKNGILNMYFSNDSIIGYVNITSRKISEIVCCEEHSNATHTVIVANFDVVQEIKDSEDYLDTANDKLKNDEITISTKGFMNKARLGIGKTILKVISWFK